MIFKVFRLGAILIRCHNFTVFSFSRHVPVNFITWTGFNVRNCWYRLSTTGVAIRYLKKKQRRCIFHSLFHEYHLYINKCPCIIHKNAWWIRLKRKGEQTQIHKAHYCYTKAMARYAWSTQNNLIKGHNFHRICTCILLSLTKTKVKKCNISKKNIETDIFHCFVIFTFTQCTPNTYKVSQNDKQRE